MREQERGCRNKIKQLLRETGSKTCRTQSIYTHTCPSTKANIHVHVLCNMHIDVMAWVTCMCMACAWYYMYMYM